MNVQPKKEPCSRQTDIEAVWMSPPSQALSSGASSENPKEVEGGF